MKLVKSTHKDLEEFEILFRKHFQNMVLYAYKFLYDYNEAEDIVQDVFFSFWQKRNDLDIKAVDSYLFAAVKHQCQNNIRHAKVVAKYEKFASYVESKTDTPHDAMVGLEVDNVIRKTLDELPDKSRKIFIMNRFESKKYREIADELSISMKTVEAHMGKVLKLLRLNLSQYTARI